MGTYVTEQQAKAVELTVRASLNDALGAMAIDADAVKVFIEYRTGDTVEGDAMWSGLEVVVAPRIPTPAASEVLAAGSAVLMAAPEVSEDNVLTAADGNTDPDEPLQEGVDFFIEMPDKPPAPKPKIVEPALMPGESPIYDL